MTTFLRVMADKDNASNLLTICTALRSNIDDSRLFEVPPESFLSVPGAPFAYWITDEVRRTFQQFPQFESETRLVRQGGVTGNDDRYIRLWWETSKQHSLHKDWTWVPFAKGGTVSRWYGDNPVNVVWDSNRGTFGGFTGLLHRPSEKPSSADHYFKGGLTWPLRAAHFAPTPLPRGSIFSIRGYAILAEPNELLVIAAICNSRAFDYLFKISLGRFGFPEFVVGILQKLPFPIVDESLTESLSSQVKGAWSLKRTLDTVEETSHAFVLPAVLRSRLADYDPPAIEVELTRIQATIDDVAFDLYGFSKADRAAVLRIPLAMSEDNGDGDKKTEDDIQDEDSAAPIDHTVGLLSWAVGVASGRFDWRLATGGRGVPPEPDPFDPLPEKSPGMLPNATEPFHAHPGILVDDPGHPHDIARLVEEVLTRVDVPVPQNVRKWLQRDFFPFHLQRYSKSRRKAPIYWPLSTVSANYTLWLYYPSLSSQTLYTAVNDFIEPKLKRIGQDVADLRNKGSARSRDDERSFEALQTFELELFGLRDTLLQIAPTYWPNHDDGVQIAASPLWPLFRHKPWQKLLKDTWAKLGKGDYDWANLAMVYWPNRVREKCKTDRSLAIAHNLEELYAEPVSTVKPRGKRAVGGTE
jgi:hypothetical protein